MSDCEPPTVVEPTTAEEPGPPDAGPPCRPPLAEKALSESFGRLRYQDTSLMIWQQQQQDLQTGPPSTYLTRSQSAWYSRYGNPAVLVRDKTGLKDTEGQSRICSVM
ncbi:putative uncharacterized protein BRD3OS [Solea solea]|uniref:putative uncharacterized protein BRD3OS n=1 Tax=Solea solea TaxID=90069 RepID=UPI00272CA8C5|nr:putative uncharacterized protein BRD3OS [Solea solea]